MTRLKKPLTRLINTRQTFGLSTQIVVTLYPDGTLLLREFRRHHPGYCLDIGALLSREIIRDGLNRPPKG